MKLAKDGKSVTLAIGEFEAAVRHLQQLEKVVAQFEKSEAAKVHLPPDLQGTWGELKKFLEAEEAKAHPAGAGAEPRARKQFCCELSSDLGTLKCETFNSRYLTAWLGCVGQAILAKVNAELVSGSCDSVSGCKKFVP
jgi:hypothetical protein